METDFWSSSTENRYKDFCKVDGCLQHKYYLSKRFCYYHRKRFEERDHNGEFLIGETHEYELP